MKTTTIYFFVAVGCGCGQKTPSQPVANPLCKTLTQPAVTDGFDFHFYATDLARTRIIKPEELPQVTTTYFNDGAIEIVYPSKGPLTAYKVNERSSGRIETLYWSTLGRQQDAELTTQMTLSANLTVSWSLTSTPKAFVQHRKLLVCPDDPSSYWGGYRSITDDNSRFSMFGVLLESDGDIRPKGARAFFEQQKLSLKMKQEQINCDNETVSYNQLNITNTTTNQIHKLVVGQSVKVGENLSLMFVDEGGENQNCRAVRLLAFSDDVSIEKTNSPTNALPDSR